MDVVIVSRRSPFAYAMKLVSIRMYTLIVNYVAKAFHFLGIQVALVPLEVQVVFL